jgi:predicted outer membrane repeat protein
MRTLFPAGILLAACSCAVQAQSLTVTVGNGAACNFPSLQAAVASVGVDVDLTVLLQGRDAGDSQGIYPGALALDRQRAVTVIGDAGAGLSPCTAAGATRAPKLVPPAVIAGYMVRIGDRARVAFDGVEIGATAQGGIVIESEATLELRRVTMRGNRTPGGVSGAAIQIDGADVRIVDSSFLDNRSAAAGGAIFCSANAPAESRITLEGSVLFGSASAPNRAAFDGGAIALLRRCTLTSEGDVRFVGNIAERDGGAIAAASQLGTPQDGSDINLVGSGVFEGNFAGRNGGALLLASQNELEIDAPHAFIDNDAGRDGGAIAATGPTLAADSGELEVDSTTFLLNSARRGGAVWIDGREAQFTSRCESRRESLRDQYCASFQLNTALGATAASAQGGALLVGAGGEVRIDGYEFRNNDAHTAGGLRGLGAALAAEGGSLLRVSNSLLWRNGHDDPDREDGFEEDTTAIELLGAGNRLELTLSTIVQQFGDEYLRLQNGASAQLIGVIAAENRSGANGLSDPGGGISGSCNNVHIGPPPPPTDPRFVPAPGSARGLFRLAGDSPMRARCRLSEVQGLPGVTLQDMDGVARTITGSGANARIDAGAFTHVAKLRATAACEGVDLRVTISEGDAAGGIRIEGNGPRLPEVLAPESAERSVRLIGPGSWTGLTVEETDGDLERIALGDIACGAAPGQLFRDGFEPQP